MDLPLDLYLDDNFLKVTLTLSHVPQGLLYRVPSLEPPPPFHPNPDNGQGKGLTQQVS